MRISIFLLFVCMSSLAFSQSRKSLTIYAGDKKPLTAFQDLYLVDTLINPFIGKWISNSGDSCLQVSFAKVTASNGSSTNKLVTQYLHAWFHFEINKKMVYKTPDNTPEGGGSYGQKAKVFVTLAKLTPAFFDPQITIVFILINSQSMHVQYLPHSHNYPRRNTAELDFLPPENIVFTKVNE